MRHGGSQAQKLNTAQLRGGAALILLAMALAACSSTLGSMPTELGGLPADAPAKPQGEQLAYPAVHDMPPPRGGTVLTPAQLKQAEAELTQARERQTRQSADPKAR